MVWLSRKGRASRSESLRTLFSNYSCAERKLEALTHAELSRLALHVQHHSSSSGTQHREGREESDEGALPLPLLEVMPVEEFEAAIRRHRSVLSVVHFSAEWCGACGALTPLLAQIAMRSPFARFLSVDVDSLPVRRAGPPAPTFFFLFLHPLHCYFCGNGHPLSTLFHPWWCRLFDGLFLFRVACPSSYLGAGRAFRRRLSTLR